MLLYSTLNYKSTIKSDYLQDTVYNLLDSTFELPKSGFSFNIFEVTKDYVARPDLISYDIYNDSKYADIICKINGISNPFELNEGVELIIPDANSLQSFYIDALHNPGTNEEEEELFLYTRNNKQNKKRKANEAIVGDSRFKIDSASGIIIY